MSPQVSLMYNTDVTESKVTKIPSARSFAEGRITEVCGHQQGNVARKKGKELRLICI